MIKITKGQVYYEIELTGISFANVTNNVNYISQSSELEISVYFIPNLWVLGLSKQLKIIISSVYTQISLQQYNALLTGLSEIVFVFKLAAS